MKAQNNNSHERVQCLFSSWHGNEERLSLLLIRRLLINSISLLSPVLLLSASSPLLHDFPV